MTIWTFAGALILIGGAYLLLSGFVRTWVRFRGYRVITCPQNGMPAAVHVDAIGAAKWMALAGESDLHLNACTRWPAMAACGQECLAQIESSPEGCLVKTIVTRWYEGRLCAFCNRPVEAIVWHERPASLRAPDGSTREWKEFRPEDLPLVFRTHQAVCWPCHVRESFRREHPTWVVERPQHDAAARPVLRPSLSVY